MNNKLICKKFNSFVVKHEEKCFVLLFFLASLILHVLHIGCITRFLTGMSCPGCGMTRAMIHIAKLDFKGAMYYHPLVVTLPIIALLFMFKSKMNVIVLNTLLILIIIAFFLVYIYRLLDVNNDVVYVDITKSFYYKLLQCFY